jgi:serine/threonine protein kinase
MDDEQLMRNEIEILMKVEHPNIIKIHEVYEDAKYIHLVMEL